jgi:dihydrofolate reductase
MTITETKPRTIYYVAASADGYIADRSGKLDWLFPFEKAEGVGAHYEAFMRNVGALAMGRDTYEFVLAHGGAWAYPGKPTWVFTHRECPRFAGEGVDLRFTSADVGAVHEELVRAAGGKDVWLVGGGNLVAQFAARGLLDEIHLGVAPVVLGGGVPFLPVARAAPLELLATTRFGMGFVELRYRVPPAR